MRSVTETLLPTVAREKLASFVDAYVDANAFRVDEARILGEKARALGLGVRLHVGQFADVGGAELAADLGALSADHLEHVSDAGIGRLAASGRKLAGRSGQIGRGALGLAFALVGAAILTGVDLKLEAAFIDTMPDWLMTFATRL